MDRPIVECKCGCGHLFKQDHPGHDFWQRECARRYEWAQRRSAEPDLYAEIDSIVLAMGEQIKRALKRR